MSSDTDLEQMRIDLAAIRAEFERLQWTTPTYAGGLTVRVFTGAGAGDVQLQGQNVYGSTFDTCIDPQSAADFYTDINVWSRGGVSTAGVVTNNTTSVLVGPTGGPFVPLAPGESITLRKKSPANVFIRAGKATAAADQVVVFW